MPSLSRGRSITWAPDPLRPDAALVLKEMAGYDPKDPASADLPAADYDAAPGKTRGLRIGLPRPYFYEELDPQIEAATNAALSVLIGLGGIEIDTEIETGNEFSLPVLQAEAYAFHQASVVRSPERYDPQTLRRIRAGAEITTAAYILARRRMEELRRSAGDVFEKVDVLLTPTTRVPPFTIAELQDPDQLRPRELRMLLNTRPFNALGLPTLSVPCGFTDRGLPLGLQITGPAGGEGSVLALARTFEQATEWRHRSPRHL